jgi:hypothetical protein
MTQSDPLRYPIGRFDVSQSVTADTLRTWIESIEKTPETLRAAVNGLDETQLDTPYRPQGWTVRQVVHHLPDSHMNSYIRFKLAATEEAPTIRPYDEVRWAELREARTAPIEVSLDLLDALHRRWVLFLRSLSPADFLRTLRHPEIGELVVGTSVGLYAWHGEHHIAHITGLRERQGWS